MTFKNFFIVPLIQQRNSLHVLHVNGTEFHKLSLLKPSLLLHSQILYCFTMICLLQNTILKSESIVDDMQNITDFLMKSFL